MIKGKLTDGTLLFGLSERNIELLKEGKPIKFNLKVMGLEDRNIIICYGKTEDEMFIALSDYMDLKTTKINLDENDVQGS